MRCFLPRHQHHHHHHNHEHHQDSDLAAQVRKEKVCNIIKQQAKNVKAKVLSLNAIR